jgi:hypothetical protein
LSVENIVREVRAEISRLQQVLALLGAEAVHVIKPAGGSVSSEVDAGKKPRRKISAAGRRRIAVAQKARWAKIRAAKK